ncbi:MAG TPA: DNA-3-methyladenine glycosylase I [Dehalococcoidia bacterium]|jgi:DNA-3-methyladenine glycosylase I
MADAVYRCAWAKSELATEYHDSEWGVPAHDDARLFEMLTLEGAQAGLSWETILRKRDGYRKAFEGFDPARIARYGDRQIERLLADPGIVRNRAKVASTVRNAQAVVAVIDEFGSFDQFVWSLVDGAPIQNARRSLDDIPPRTAESDAMSKTLKSRGFGFVGSTICYAFMQAVGMVNDHEVRCYRYPELSGAEV